jgi:ABC-type bacteriocin/lantibiotic exporter with double-glycine peptidase domain
MDQKIAKADGLAPADPGLSVLVMLLRLHGIGADPEQIRHRFGGTRIGIPEMLRCAREFGLKARERYVDWERLETTPVPAIAALRDGGHETTQALRKSSLGPCRVTSLSVPICPARYRVVVRPCCL